MIRINLLPQRETAQKESGKQILFLFAILIFVEIAALFYISYEQSNTLSAAQTENNQLRKQLADLKKKTAEVVKLKKQKQKKINLITVLIIKMKFNSVLEIRKCLQL